MAQDLLELIDADPSVVHGQARFRETRIPVSVVLDCLAAGMTDAEIHEQYPSLPAGAARAPSPTGPCSPGRSCTRSSRRLVESQAR